MKNFWFMRRFLLAGLLLAWTSLLSMASETQQPAVNLISEVVIQNACEYDFAHAFTSGEPMRFRLQKEVINGEWECTLMNIDGTFVEMPFESIGNECVFSPYDVKFYVWRDCAFKRYNEEENRDEFILRVSYKTENGDVDSRLVTLALLPCRPTIENVKFTYEIMDSEFPMIDGILTFTVKSKGADRFSVDYTQSYQLTDENLFFHCSEHHEANDVLDVYYDLADWGEYITVMAGNDFGFLRTGIICTTDYISDTDFLERIENVRQFADSKMIEESKIHKFNWDNEYLRLDCEPRELNVYSLDGKQYLIRSSGKEFDLSMLVSGIYVVTYLDDKNNRITYKINKK